MKQTFSIAEFFSDQFDRLFQRERRERRRRRKPCGTCGVRSCAGCRKLCLPCAAGFTLAASGTAI